jgi:ketosteroid isomerase-like protein
MKASELGERLVEMYNSGRHDDIVPQLYSPEIKSYEADGMLSEGLEGLKQKYDWFEANFEMHATTAKGPFPHGDDQVAVVFWMDTTHKPSGERSQMEEVAVYQVKDGKIVEERFFYPGG